MSLDVYLNCRHCGTVVYERNITHNLGQMAEKAGLYTALWRPEEEGLCIAKDLIRPLQEGIGNMIANKAELKIYNPENGWGNYENLLEFAGSYLKACERYFNCGVNVSR